MNQKYSNDDIIQLTLSELNQWDYKVRNCSMFFTKHIESKFSISERHSNRLVDEVMSYGLLIKIRHNEYILSELGRWVCEQPHGWISYKRQKIQDNDAKTHQNATKTQLEISNLKLQKEALEYQKSIRDMEEKVKLLGVELQHRANLLQKKNNIATWGSAIIGAIIGALATLLIEKI